MFESRLRAVGFFCPSPRSFPSDSRIVLVRKTFNLILYYTNNSVDTAPVNNMKILIMNSIFAFSPEIMALWLQ
jgi:hypothetical protein